jgi:glycogen operon protein
MEVWPGEPYPLGATFDGAGTNFALFSEVARRVELCIFDDAGGETRIPLPERTGFVWHGYLPELMDGTRYAFRVHGPYEPSRGLRCNGTKLLLDPYAKAIEGGVRFDPAVFSYVLGGDPDKGASIEDSAPFMPRCVVVSPYFDWRDDRPLRIPWHETVIYELHVKGFTALHPDVPEALRGTYAGLAHPAAVEYLKGLGVTAVELMPVHQFVHDDVLVQRGLRNYWGYNSIGYLAPHDEYATTGRSGEQVHEFKHMVRTLHEAGIEVILDVVYNHTAEGNRFGPTLSFRGIDNPAYYRLSPEDRRRYVDFTGCGNSLNMTQPAVLQLIMDSLRYWVEAMHVDGFRFDLAATLARELHEVDRLSAFFDIIHQDPVISRVKLIAEPWDLGEGGYQVGNFPVHWSEWNGKYRDTVRDFWRGADKTLPEFAQRFTGSSDLYESSARRPHASINFITAHDGFTLHDLVAYDRKHNLDNGEGNRDGTDDNRSWNCGVEGETDDPEVRRLRARQARNFLATLFLSQGVPMLVAGDELGRTQRGNNNAYCQDNELSWVDWAHVDEPLLEFTRELLAFRQAHPVFRRRGFFQGHSIRGHELGDIGWFRPDGEEMSDRDWKTWFAKSLGIFLNGLGIPYPDAHGQRVEDSSFYVLMNAHHEPITYRLPPRLAGCWRQVLSTAGDDPWAHGVTCVPGHPLEVTARSILVLERAERGAGAARPTSEEPGAGATRPLRQEEPGTG